MIILRNLSLAFGDKKLFDNLTLNLEQHNKIGIVGRNGAGKSTLLKVIVGQHFLDDGSVTIQSKKNVAYLPQETVMDSSLSVFDEAFTVFDHFTQLEQDAQKIEHQLESQPSNAHELVEKYSSLQEQLAYFNRIASEQKTDAILTGLGFSNNQKKQSVNTLSVGWKMRVVLAKLLLQEADFYLFDEPTNHLDIVAKEWFIEFLQNAPFGYLLITHDRHFLQHGCNAILELENGNGTMYHGNYDFYTEQKKERLLLKEQAYKNQQRDIAQKKRFIERNRAKASKAKMAQNMIKQLERMDMIQLDRDNPVMNITFPESVRPGKVILTVKNVSHAFGDKQLFKNASCEIKRGQKVALIAPNGTGKTTLFNLIAGKLALQSGSIDFGHNVQMAFFEQDQTRVLIPENTILQEVYENCSNVSESTIRSFLGCFLFSGDDTKKKIKVLSGGERNRVAMVKVLLQKANFLLLDEPTNHLDIQSQDLLLQALKQYDGTILIVSHDHSFIQKLADTILELTPNKLFAYPGTYEEFLQDKKPDIQKTSNSSDKAEQPKIKNANDYKMHKQIRRLERQLKKYEEKKNTLSLKLADLEYNSTQYNDTIKNIDKIDNAIKTIEEQLDELLA